jgi:antitoxin component YwqK of YwqJK toxin-antitoxin module
MKKKMILTLSLLTGFAFSQEVKPVLEQKGDLVKATYYFANGQIQQEGFFKDGKLTGQWVSYDAEGNKKSTGEYAHGAKTGKWFFWNEKTLHEVDYSANKIATVNNWKHDGVVNKK